MTLIRTYKATYVLKIRESTSNLPEWAPRKYFSVQCSAISEREVLCLKVPRFLLLVLLIKGINISMEHCWNDTDRAKRKYCREPRPQCHKYHHKSRLDWPEMEWCFPRSETRVMIQLWIKETSYILQIYFETFNWNK